MGIVRQMGADIADGMTRNMELVGTKGGPHNQERNQKRGSRLFGQTRDRLFWEPATRMWTVGIARWNLWMSESSVSFISALPRL